MTRNTKGPSRPESDNVVPLRFIADPTPEAFAAILELVAHELAELRREVAALRRQPTREASKLDLLYGVPAIAACLSMTAPQVYHLASSGALPSFKIGGKVCARRSDLDAWLAELATGGQG